MQSGDIPLEKESNHKRTFHSLLALLSKVKKGKPHPAAAGAIRKEQVLISSSFGRLYAFVLCYSSLSDRRKNTRFHIHRFLFKRCCVSKDISGQLRPWTRPSRLWGKKEQHRTGGERSPSLVEDESKDERDYGLSFRTFVSHRDCRMEIARRSLATIHAERGSGSCTVEQ